MPSTKHLCQWSISTVLVLLYILWRLTLQLDQFTRGLQPHVMIIHVVMRGFKENKPNKTLLVCPNSASHIAGCLAQKRRKEKILNPTACILQNADIQSIPPFFCILYIVMEINQIHYVGHSVTSCLNNSISPDWRGWRASTGKNRIAVYLCVAGCNALTFWILHEYQQ